MERAKSKGAEAYLRTFPEGGHELQLVGPLVENPIGKTVFEGRKIEITPAVEETYLWIREKEKSET